MSAKAKLRDGQLHLPQDEASKLADCLRVLHDLIADADDENAKTVVYHSQHPDYAALSAEDVDMQRSIFEHFDIDSSGQLAQVETRRMMKAMNLFETDEELLAVVKEMDDDNSGTIDFEEYLEYLDNRCKDNPEFQASYRKLSQRTKLGFDGTKWRKHANVAWLNTNATIIICGFVILYNLIYFRFILVPLVMAYFLTFLLGPIQDFLVQRPLICCNMVYCDKPGIRPALEQNTRCCGKHYNWEDGDPTTMKPYQTPQQRWTELDKRGKHVMKKEDGQYEARTMSVKWEGEDTNCCYFVPPKQCSKEPMVGGGPLKNVCYEFWYMAKIPEALSVIVSIAIAFSIVVVVAMQVSNEIIAVLSDPDFRHQLKLSAVEFNQLLAVELGVSVSELEEFHNTSSGSESNLDEVESLSASDLSAAAEPFVMVINDIVFTLLLCMYMLATRTLEVEEDVNKAAEVMNISEKIRSKVKHYVVLKTALSALTGGLVGMFLRAFHES